MRDRNPKLPSVVVSALLLFAGAGVAAGAAAPKHLPLPNLDIRSAKTPGLRAVVEKAVGTAAPAVARAAGESARTMAAAAARLREGMPRLEVRFDPRTGAVETVRNQAGALTAEARGANAADVALAWVRAHRALYGLTDGEIGALRVKGVSRSPRSGLQMVRLEQVANGIPVFQSDTRILVDRTGRVVKTVGLLVPGAGEAPALAGLLAAPVALQSALKTVGIVLDPAKATVKEASADGTSAKVVTASAYVKGPVTSRLVYFPLGARVLVPAWMQVSFCREADYTTVVDAHTGALLFRKNIRQSASTQEARFSVYTQADGRTPAESPAPHSPTTVTPGSGTQFPEIARTTVSMSAVQDLTGSPNGWIADGGNTTTGNNVDAYLDTDADNAPDAGLLDLNGRPVGNLDGGGNQRDFLGTGYDYTPAPQGGNPDAGTAPTDTQFRRGSVTHLFYLTNWYHDRLYNFGFDEAAGNFQTDNFGRGGTGGDPVLAEAQDGSGTDNSNFATPPDGQSGRMQMYIFDFPTPNRDGALDATIVLHELTHGLSNRLIGDGNGLIWDEGGAMGEGWSDFYALSLLNSSNAAPPNAEYAAGAYATYQFLGLTDNYLYGIRRFPYSTDNLINPLTWADVDGSTYSESGGIAPSPIPFRNSGALEVHNAGEIWANTLWEVRSRIIADPAGANGDVPTGNDTALQLVTDALKMTPNNPSFADARDAIIDADCATNACANEASIWGGFADRGLGYKAVAPIGQSGIQGLGGFIGVGQSFDVPYLDVASLATDDSLGNNNGAADPGEPIRLGVTLANPWRLAAKGVAGASGTLTTSTPGITIVTNSATWGAIAAQGTATGTPFLFTISPAATCGSSAKFTLTVTSALGTKAVDFTLRLGTASGPGAPVTYTRTAPGGLAIPDDDYNGVSDTMTISDDVEIQSLLFRLDSLTHTFTGDLAVGLKAPNGYGTDLIYFRGLFTGEGDGDNFTNTVIDEAAVNDLNLSGSADAPFTGSWLPAFNSPIWSLFGIPNLGPDPVGQLSRLAGTSTAGDWKVFIRDEAEADTGTLNTWSLVVTPTAYACAAFTPIAAVAGSMTVSAPPHYAGSAITYTVTLTNTGFISQADNPGNEFTDVLPAGVSLVSAGASSGTAVANVGTNTVTWNGALPAVTGSVTVTIQATINAGAAGTNVSNQGTIAFDSDGNNTNDASTVTDDPSTVAVGDPTTFAVPAGAAITAQKAVGGSFLPGGAVTYTITLTNLGTGAQADNPGNEFVDVLPATITLVSAMASSGTAVANVGTNTVNWNGAIPSAGVVTITIGATISSGAAAGTMISNQGSTSFDPNGDGANDAVGVTDDPATPTAADPTVFQVAAGVQVPTLSLAGLLLLGAALAVAALAVIRRAT